MNSPFVQEMQLFDVPELTDAALESARWKPGVGCLVDRFYPQSPLIIAFGYVDWEVLPVFDFFAPTKKLEEAFELRFNRVLVRDIVNAWYHRGVPGLGSHVDEVAASLRGLIRPFRPSQVIAIGQGMGGYGAIMFGMLLNADRIIAFAPLSHLNLDEAVCYGDHRFLAMMEELKSDPPKSRYYDLVALGRALDYHGELHVIFGTHPVDENGDSVGLNALHALRLAQLPNVGLYPYPEAKHAVVQWLTDQGRLDGLLAQLLVSGGGHATAATVPADVRASSNFVPNRPSGSPPGDRPSHPASLLSRRVSESWTVRAWRSR